MTLENLLGWQCQDAQLTSRTPKGLNMCLPTEEREENRKMPDFGQYTAEEVFRRLIDSSRYDGKTLQCVRCRKPTKARLLLGAAICNDCLKK